MGEEIGILSTHDIARKPDMLIIMGTSLKVHGIKKLVKDFAGAVHSPSATNGKSSRGQNASQSSPPMASSSKRPSTHPPSAKNAKIVVFVNRSAPPADLASIIDYWVEGDTDTWVAKCEADWRRSRPQDWEIQPTLFDSLREKGLGVPPLAEEINTFKIVKGGTKSAKPKPRSKCTRSCCIRAVILI
jgi:NAD-dependent protein deacetylase SIR2